ncbi:uncharacterized protein, YigZ family [Pilibacter termitis]|uniref:Uncharacterized protein, YigZ family n=1 Tax=Pilibacter termitis TaxID=263852 RepID=A0A1T4MSY6_9ENTE|nr:YigZ family protein [Pilibacter termitis]SJZ70093.1 uncharacterized protein, YigZ family [Pilibacter termitis]
MDENAHYFTVLRDGVVEMEVKKSRFITHIKRVKTEEEAKEFIAQIKKEHWKATHNCSAFILGNRGEIQRSNDDGEPSGTAGVPMLEVLKKNELINLVVVVTRYFGGIKLGAGGLIRAYAGSVSHTLNEIGIVKGILQQEIHAEISYSSLGKVQNFLETHTEYTLKDTLFTENVEVITLVDKENVDIYQEEITSLLNGQVTFVLGENAWNEIQIHQI